MQLVVYAKPLLYISYLRSLQKKLQLKHAKLQRSIESVLDAFNAASADLEDLKLKVTFKAAKARARESGIPTVESLDPEDLGTDRTAFRSHTLKLAYRQAARLAHPDKGGDDAEFAWVSECYKARDTAALVAFVYAKKHGVPMIEYWQAQAGAAEARWEGIRNTAEYEVARLWLSGNRERARKMAKELLEIRLEMFSLAELTGRPVVSPNSNVL